MKFSILFLSLMISSVSFAVNRESGEFGFEKTYATCEGELNDGTMVSFKVRATVSPKLVDAVLVNEQSNELIEQFLCKRGGDIVPGVPSAGKIEWNCAEYKHVDDGDISVELMRGGPTGVVTGRIFQKQMYPLQPAVIGSLLCK